MKSQCHDAIDSIAPAMVGPAAVAIAITIAFSASPRPRIFLGLNHTRQRNVDTHDTGCTNSLQSPRNQDQGKATGNRHIAEANVKTVTPIRKLRL